MQVHDFKRKNVQKWTLPKDGGEGWIRTTELIRGQIYSLLPLTTRPPLHEMCAYYALFSTKSQEKNVLIHCHLRAGHKDPATI